MPIYFSGLPGDISITTMVVREEEGAQYLYAPSLVSSHTLSFYQDSTHLWPRLYSFQDKEWVGTVGAVRLYVPTIQEKFTKLIFCYHVPYLHMDYEIVRILKNFLFSSAFKLNKDSGQLRIELFPDKKHISDIHFRYLQAKYMNNVLREHARGRLLGQSIIGSQFNRNIPIEIPSRER